QRRMNDANRFATSRTHCETIHVWNPECSEFTARLPRHGIVRKDAVISATANTVRAPIDDELELARALIQRNFRKDWCFERDVAEPFLLEYLSQAHIHPGDRRALTLAIQPWLQTDGESKRARPRDLHLKARHALHEDLIDGVRTEIIGAAVGAHEC